MKLRLSGLFLIVLLTGCVANRPFHMTFEPCTIGDNTNPCKMIRSQPTNSIQRYVGSEPSENYLLGFVEFDDQGQLFDRRQLTVLTDELSADAASQDLLMILFVHGWRHNSEETDGNLASFREILKGLSTLETAVSRHKGRDPRKVVGVYIGWRGLSVDAVGLTYLTFWDRKNTAHKVGHNGLLEVLSRMELIKNIRNESLAGAASTNATQLVVIGHSFGGAVIYSALAHILMERFIDTAVRGRLDKDTRGFGDLVVLLNPAFEALQFKTLREMAKSRAYPETQVPVIAVLTSEADTATGFWFPFGRFFSSLFEDYHADERDEDRTALGHYDPHITHDLYFADYASSDDDPSSDGSNCPSGGVTSAAKKSDTRSLENRLQSELADFQDVKEGWDSDEYGFIGFPGSELEHHLDKSGLRNPYLNIRVDKLIIPDHDTVYCKRVRDFIRHLIILSSPKTEASTGN